MIDRFLNIWLNCINIILDILQLAIDLLNRWRYFDFLLIDITHIDSDWWEQSVQFTLFILIKFIYFILVQCFILGVSLNKKLIFFFWSNINIVLHLFIETTIHKASRLHLVEQASCHSSNSIIIIIAPITIDHHDQLYHQRYYHYCYHHCHLTIRAISISIIIITHRLFLRPCPSFRSSSSMSMIPY